MKAKMVPKAYITGCPIFMISEIPTVAMLDGAEGSASEDAPSLAIVRANTQQVIPLDMTRITQDPN